MNSISDKKVFDINGFLILALAIISFVTLLIFLNPLAAGLVAGLGFIPATFIIGSGFKILGPNEARVISFFGKYVGTLKSQGLRFTIPLSTSVLVPLKMINFNTEKLKVNDLNGNPIEVAAVVVWRVRDAAQACFNIDDYKNFIFNQSETVIRTIAAKYPYDSQDGHSLRGSAEEITAKLTKELHEKLIIAGIEIHEVKLSHLAYAPEIASAMLKRQQAIAVLEARKYLIENAVVIAQKAIENFAKSDEISADKKAQIISNILITLISDKEVNPVIGL